MNLLCKSYTHVTTGIISISEKSKLTGYHGLVLLTPTLIENKQK